MKKQRQQNKRKPFLTLLFLGSRRSNSGLSSRAGSGFSPVPENRPLPSPLNSGNRHLRSSRLINAHNSAGSGDSGFGQPAIGKFPIFVEFLN